MSEAMSIGLAPFTGGLSFLTGGRARPALTPPAPPRAEPAVKPDTNAVQQEATRVLARRIRARGHQSTIVGSLLGRGETPLKSTFGS